MNDTISPDDAERLGVILYNPYSVVDVAKIAAGCDGETHRERAIDALRLLGAVEALADPWAFQYSPTKEDFAALELDRVASEIIAKATKGGNILRNQLCKEACSFAGLEVSKDTVGRRFNDWLAEAAESQARWTLAGELFDKKHPIERLDAAIDARRTKVTDEQRAAEIESFRRNFEIRRGRSIELSDEVAAMRLLRGGSPYFVGFLLFLRNLPEKKKPKVPRLKDKDGTFIKAKRNAKGQIMSPEG